MSSSSSIRRTGRVIVAATAAMVVAPMTARAVDRYYVGPTLDNWNTAANWDTIEGGGGSNGVPAAGDNAFIRGGTSKSVNFNGNYTTGNGLGTLQIDSSAGATLTLTQSANSMIASFTNIGVNGNGEYLQSGGTHTVTTAMQLGMVAGSTGTYTLSGGTLLANEIYVGGDTAQGGGVGVLNIPAGTSLVSGFLKIWDTGAATPAGTAVNLTGGSVTAAAIESDLNEQRFNWTDGNVTITLDTVTVDTMEIVYGSTHVGANVALTPTKQLAVTNSGNTLVIGAFGNGAVTQTGGTQTTAGGVYIGINPGSTGTYTSSGGVQNIGGDLELGSIFSAVGNYNLSGTGQLNVGGNERLGLTAIASFTQTGGTHTVGTTASPKSLSIAFSSGSNGTYNLSGSGQLKVNGSMGVGGSPTSTGGTGVLNITGGTATVTGDLRVWNTGGSLPSGSRINQSAGTLSVGSLLTTGNPARYNWTGGTLEITNSSLVVGSGGPLGTSLNLDAARTLRISGNSSAMQVPSTGTLSFSGGKLDLTDKKLATSAAQGTWNGSNYTGILGLVTEGRNGGVWDGPGITTSMTDATGGSGYTALGVAVASESRGIGATDTDLWGGVIVTGSDTLVMYTYGGDANLSGNVDVDDYGQIDFNAGLGGILPGWFNGDFDYSGTVDVDDYGIIDFVFGIQGPPFSTSGGVSIAAVPEPTSVSLLVVGAASLLRRRRR